MLKHRVNREPTKYTKRLQDLVPKAKDGDKSAREELKSVYSAKVFTEAEVRMFEKKNPRLKRNIQDKHAVRGRTIDEMEFNL